MSAFPPVAAIDVGTRSVQLLVAQMESTGQLRLLAHHKELIDWAGLAPTCVLKPRMVRSLARQCRRLVDLARPYQPLWRAVATHAWRVSPNAHELVAEIAKIAHLEVEIIDGLEEGRLTSLGVAAGLYLQDEPFLAVDIGGGSTEVVVRHGDKLTYAHSFPLGALSLTQTHFGTTGIVTVKGLQDLRAQLTGAFAPHLQDWKTLSFARATAASGSARSLASVFLRRRAAGQEVHASALPQQAVLGLLEEVVACADPKQTSQQLGLDVGRSRYLCAGAAVLESIGRGFGVDTWQISSHGLREGLVLDTLARHAPSPYAVEVGLLPRRWASIHQLALRTGVDTAHAQAVMFCALELHKALQAAMPGEGHPLHSARPELLAAAAWLHECGKFLNLMRYPRHSYYVIAESNLWGYLEAERLAIALIVRYHRKASGKRRAFERQKMLSTDEVMEIDVLTAVLQVAVGAQYFRRGLTLQWVVRQHRDGLELQARGTHETTPPLVHERRMHEGCQALERVLKRKVKLRPFTHSLP